MATPAITGEGQTSFALIKKSPATIPQEIKSPGLRQWVPSEEYIVSDPAQPLRKFHQLVLISRIIKDVNTPSVHQIKLGYGRLKAGRAVSVDPLSGDDMMTGEA
jgi:hypothetical protein